MLSVQRLLNILLLAVVYLRINFRGLLFAIVALLRGEASPYQCVHFMAKLLDPRYTCVKSSHKLNGGKTMYFVNHRSWADFFVDGDMIPNTSYLSRMAVIFAFPFPCICGYINQFVWFFKRQRGISREWFTSFFKHNWDVRKDSGVIVYPEGHRYKGEGTLKLKTGVMEVAYNLKTPCQIVLSKGKENLMDEINLTIHKQALITVYVSDVLDPTQFETKEAWFEYVNEQWKDAYEKLEKGESDGRIFSEPLPGIPEECRKAERLPLKRRLIASACVGSVVALLGYLFLSCVCLRNCERDCCNFVVLGIWKSAIG